jgi:hypothetical protein
MVYHGNGLAWFVGLPIGCADLIEIATCGGLAVRQLALCVAIVLLALMPVRGDDPPKKAKTKQTPKEQYEALVKEYGEQQTENRAAIAEAKGDERSTLIQKNQNLGKEFAERFFKLAEDHPKDPVAAESLFWIMQNGAGSPVYAKAAEKVTELIGKMPINDLSAKLVKMRTPNAGIISAVVKRAEKEKGELRGEILSWAAINGSVNADGQKAAKLLVEKYPDHKSMEALCAVLGRRFSQQTVDTLKLALEKSTKTNIKAAAALNLGICLYLRTDALGDQLSECDKVAADAEKYLNLVVDKYGKDIENKRKEAEKELHWLRTLRVGKEAQQIDSADLEGTEFKLTDYRGKVVLLDFWGNW